MDQIYISRKSDLIWFLRCDIHYNLGLSILRHTLTIYFTLLRIKFWVHSTFFLTPTRKFRLSSGWEMWIFSFFQKYLAESLLELSLVVESFLRGCLKSFFIGLRAQSVSIVDMLFTLRRFWEILVKVFVRVNFEIKFWGLTFRLWRLWI